MVNLCSVLVGTLVFSALSAMAAEDWTNTKDLKKVKHIVLFMQENRAFDHYFGTMAGVRGFQDPNVHVSENTGKDVFHQPVDQSILAPKPPKDVHYLKPFYLNWAGGDWKEKTQCMLAGLNDWIFNHAAYDKGQIDRWALRNSAYSVGYFKEDDIPIQWKLADSFTVGDMYYESIIAMTIPNRVAFFTGTINPREGSNVPGSNEEMGGPVLDNVLIDGCRNFGAGPVTCYPLKWKTVPEHLQDAGISWQVYQDQDNFGDDALSYFQQYQDSAKNKGELARRGTSYPGLEKFYEDAKNGNLPEVSYIVAPENLAEHPPFMPKDGGWLQAKVAEAVMNGKDWDSTVLIYNYDETGGWADHVMGPHPPKNVTSEWMVDPYLPINGNSPIGPGFRVPFYIVSPWTRGGHVFTEHAAHESTILFMEEWSKAHGKPFYSKEIPDWRRSQLSNLVKAFDFSNKDTRVLNLPPQPTPSKDKILDRYNGGIVCLLKHIGLVFPPVPYGKQNSGNSMEVVKGYKSVRGDITEGRYLTLEANGRALSHANGKLGSSRVNSKRDDKNQLFVVHWLGSEPKDNSFHITTPQGVYVTKSMKLSKNKSDAASFSFTDMGNGAGYSVRDDASGKSLSIGKDGSLSLADGALVKIYSVTL